MKKFIALLSTSAIALCGLTGLAHATMIDISLGNSSSDLVYSPGSNVLNPNINLANAGSSLVFNNNASVINPSSTSPNHIQPTPIGTLYGQNYLSVQGLPTPGLATFTLASGMNEFGFTWGTIDAYNTLTLSDSRNVSYSITGTDILKLITASVAGFTQSDVLFTDSHAPIVKAEFSSTNNSFEVANFSVSDPPSAVPLPSSLPLFGTALIGLAVLTRQRKTFMQD